MARKKRKLANRAKAKPKLKVCNLNEFLVVTHVTGEDRKHAYRTGRFAEMTLKQAGLTD